MELPPESERRTYPLRRTYWPANQLTTDVRSYLRQVNIYLKLIKL